MSLPFVTRAYFVFKIILGWSEIPLYRELMTEENFFDKFNRIHNPEYYHDKSKTKKKKTKKKKTDRKRYTVKRYSVFKVQD